MTRSPKPRKPTRKAREMPVPQARACDGVGCPLVHPHYTFAALKQTKERR